MVWFAEPQAFPIEHLAAIVKQETGGDLHPAIAGPGLWLDDNERAAANQELAELRALYGRRPTDVDDPELADVAFLLSTPPEARFAQISWPRQNINYRVLAARNPWFGLVAVYDQDAVHVRTFHDEHVSEVVVASLDGRLWRSGDAEIQVTRSALLRAADEDIGLRQPPPEIQSAQRLMSLDAYLVCEFHAECQLRGQPRRRTDVPLRLFGFGSESYDAGSWMLSTTVHRGEEHLHLAPVDAAGLASEVEQLRRSLDD